MDDKANRPFSSLAYSYIEETTRYPQRHTGRCQVPSLTHQSVTALYQIYRGG